jgi:hypothetical protein
MIYRIPVEHVNNYTTDTVLRELKELFVVKSIDLSTVHGGVIVAMIVW